jgi:hypothetical protein
LAKTASISRKSSAAASLPATSYPIPYAEEFQFAPDDRYIVCAGSVGYSRDPYHWQRYAIFDSKRDTIIFKAPERSDTCFLNSGRSKLKR